MALYAGIELPNKPDPENIRRLDLLPIPMVRSMMRYGMRIDPDHFRDLSFRLQSRMTTLRRDITSQIPPEALDRFVELAGMDDPIDYDDDGMEVMPEDQQLNVDSGKKIAELLYDVLGLHKSGSVKVKKTKGGGTLSTGKKTLEQLKRDHPVVQLILDYRESSKLDGTYAKTMPRHARFHPKGKDCPLCGWDHRENEFRTHTQIMTTRTGSGRFATKNVNLGNIPARSPLGQQIRMGFVSSVGCVISQRDWAQIELRLGADASGDENMLRIYLADGDIHVDTAMRSFDKTEAEVTSDVGKLLYRAPCKNVNFAVFYLISAPGLLDLMASTFATAGVPMPDYMTERWCEEFIQKWFRLYPGVKAYLDRQETLTRRHSIVWTPCGRVRRVPEVRSTHQWIQAAGVRQACNHGIQGYSADIMKLAMGELWERLGILSQYGIKARPTMTIYDELLVECEEDDGETVQELMAEIMDNVLVDKQSGKLCCLVPIRSDGKLLLRWKK